MALSWFKTGNHTIVGPMLPTALGPLCVGLLGAYCLTVILKALYIWRTQPKYGITGQYRSQVFFFSCLLFFPFLFFLLLSFFLSSFSLFFPLSSLWATGPDRLRSKRPMWRSPKRHNGQSAYGWATNVVNLPKPMLYSLFYEPYLCGRPLPLHDKYIVMYEKCEYVILKY